MGQTHVQTAPMSVADSTSATEQVSEPSGQKEMILEFIEGWVQT